MEPNTNQLSQLFEGLSATGVRTILWDEDDNLLHADPGMLEIYQNEEFNLLQAALNIEDGLDGLRYNKVVIATDADVDGMHIRLLLITFFLQFFPDLVKRGHLYVLQTPLFLSLIHI